MPLLKLRRNLWKSAQVSYHPTLGFSTGSDNLACENGLSRDAHCLPFWFWTPVR